MKKYFMPFFSCIFLCCSCSNSDSKKEESKQDKQEKEVKHVEWELDNQREKISLLASMKNVPYDSLYGILKDYNVQTGTTFGFSSLPDSISYERIIQSVAQKHHTSKERIASLVFSFKYEMRTPDEIVEEADEDRAQAEYDPRDDQ